MNWKILACIKSQDSFDIKTKTNGSGIKYRHVQCILLFFGVVIAFALRVHISVAVVSMMDNSANTDFQKFNWTETEKSYVLSAFLWGYTITPLPGSFAAKRYGPKICLFLGIFISSLLAIITPLSATIGGWKAVCALRALSGLIQGFILTSAQTFIAKWAPYNERAQTIGIAVIGSSIGKVLMLAGSGLITTSILGWPGIFYIPGVIGIIWTVTWWLFGASSPADCKFITAEEREYIEKSIEQAGKKDCESGDKVKTEKPPTPLKKIIFSTAYLGLFTGLCSGTFDTWLLMTETPAFLNGVFGINIRNSAFISSLPYIAAVFMSITFLLINNALIKRNYFSLITRRKIFNTIGDWIPACLLLSLGYLSKDHAVVAIGILIVSVSVSSARAYGAMVNFIDISPTYAGILYGITSTFANVISLLGPIVVGLIVTDTANMEQWKIVFSISSGILFIGNFIFLVFGKEGPL